MAKWSAVVISRNDNYGGNLKERASFCLNSLIHTFDEVLYIDWNSDTNSLLYDIEDNIEFKGNLKHFVINPETVKILTNFDSNAQKCCEVLARNVGLRRAEGEWIVSTNIDVICPRREDLDSTPFDENTFYTISRRGATLNKIETVTDGGDVSIGNFYNGEFDYSKWRELREYLISHSQERHFEEKVANGDDYSLINCCGDFQVAKRHIWHDLRGMEEELIYCLYTDTNIQKKAVMHGYQLKALYSPALFHIGHGKGGGGFLDGINKVTNNINRAVINQTKTRNPETWGFSDIEIEYEVR